MTMPREALAAAVTIAIAAGAITWFTRGESRDRATQSLPAPAAREAAPVASTRPVENTAPALLPDSRLPDPEAPPAGNAEEQAAVLAGRVRAGGAGAVRALVTALNLSGFHLRQPDGTVVAPARSLGLAFHAWEINGLAALESRRRAVAAPLSDVASAFAAAIPGSTGDQVAAAILDGRRRPVRDADGPLAFWSAFIVELGRSARTHPQYDLLADVEADATYLDAIQIAMIGKRVAGDIMAAAQPERAALRPSQPTTSWLSWIAPPVYAQAQPCQFTETETDIMDWAALVTTTAFGGIVGMVGGPATTGAPSAADRVSAAAAIAGVLLTYVKLGLTQGAFEIDFELERSPFVRTTAMQPTTGEKNTIVATVTLDFGKWQWVNCARMMLNAIGLDLNVDNDGPVKGASVAWNGYQGFRAPWAIRAGPEHLVRFAGDEHNRIQTGPTSLQHAITNQLTDDNGKARVEIEGMGQEEPLGSQPRPVMKEATAAAMVVLKPANLYRDLKDAGSTAMGGVQAVLTMPAELLYRTRWSFGGEFTFPVKDWKIGNGWSGAISYRKIEHNFTENNRESYCCGGRPTRHDYSRESHEVTTGTWDVPEESGSDQLTPHFSMGSAQVAITAERTVKERTFTTGWASCRGGSHPPTSRTHTREQRGSASGGGTAQVTVNLERDGSYDISAGAPEAEPIGELTTVSTSESNNGCEGVQPSRTDTGTGTFRPGMHVAAASGKTDPESNTISGSLTRVQKFPRIGRVITHIYEWDLRR